MVFPASNRPYSLPVRASIEQGSPSQRPVERAGWERFAYRPPIDGLRAIAVMLVLLFHAGMPGIANGYIGVDVFFVLSGYLITSLIVRERLVTGTISLLVFYARRVRRLLPAAILVLLVTAFVYEWVAPPLDVMENRMGFTYAALYVSNWYFLSQAQDYFAADASPSPVLHYWSLSVEEQFYLAWPLLMIGLFAIRPVRERYGPWVLMGLAALAIAISWSIAQGNEMSGYFSTFARAYQLLMGSALAVVLLWWQKRDGPILTRDAIERWRVRLLVPVGLLILLVTGTSLITLPPWWVGMIGCLATVCVLLGMELDPQSRGLHSLSMRGPRLIGRWSYSLYLWHWPVIVLGTMAAVLPLQWWLRVPTVVLVSFLLAGLTWYAIERRSMGLQIATNYRQLVIILVGLLVTGLAAFGSLAILRVSADAQLVYDRVVAGQRVGQNEGTVVDPATEPTKAGARTILFIGDSHANFWREAFRNYANEKGTRVVFVTKISCPWMDIPAMDPETGRDFHCNEDLWEKGLEQARQLAPDVTILASRAVLSRTLLTDSGKLQADDPGWAEAVTAGVAKSLAEITPLTGRVVIIEPIPETKTSMVSCLTQGGDTGRCDQPVSVKPGTVAVEKILRAAALANPTVVTVSVDELICPDLSCPAVVNGIPTHRDEQHITVEFAQSLMASLEQLISEKGISLSS